MQGGKFFFNTVKEGESVLFATDTEKVGEDEGDPLVTVDLVPQDAANWVIAFYQATGQAHKPAKPENTKPVAANKKKDEPDGEKKHGGLPAYFGRGLTSFYRGRDFKPVQLHLNVLINKN